MRHDLQTGLDDSHVVMISGQASLTRYILITLNMSSLEKIFLRLVRMSILGVRCSR